MPSLRSAPRRLSTQAYLFALVAAVLVPLLAFAAFLLTRYAATERARFERDAAQIARQLALIIDGELAGHIALLQGLASSSSLATGDLVQFHVEAQRLVERRDQIVVLRDAGARQFLNTGRPFGTELPPAVPLSAADRAALAAGQPLVSDVYRSPLSGEARIAVAQPIIRDGALVYVLALTVPTSRIRDALLPAVPPGWLIGIGDRNGTFVTRSARHEDVTGKPGLPDYLAKAVGRSGTFMSANLEGLVSLAGYYRSPFSGWLYAANISQDVVEAPLWRSIAVFSVVGTAALALSALLAYMFGTSFTAAATGLARRAAAVGEGRPAPPMSTRLSEFALVGDALVAAAAAVEERARAEQALRTRTNELEIVLSTVPAAVWFTYDRQVRDVICNRFACELMRLPEGASAAFGSLDHVRLLKGGRPTRPEERPLERAMAGERIEDEEYTFAFVDGTTRTLLTSATALRDESGAIVGAVSVGLEITERKRGEEQRRLLVHELNHRVKNTLATVQSVALQTLRGAGSMAEARDALTDRLMALAKAHDVLTSESWEGAELHDIVSGVADPHAGRDRFVIGGPPVWLTPSLSLSLALALHELATNAVKYGALSTEGGSVTVSWAVADPLGDPRLTLRWIERGGPPVQPPARQGFGTRLIERSLSAEIGGTVTIDYAASGVVCVMEAPIRPRTAPAEPTPAK